MLEIRVVSYRGAAPAPPRSAIFGVQGGTIGRAPGNTLALEDAERYVSRTQARVRIASGRAWIANVSSANPLYVDDRELESGEEVEIRPGNEIRMGLYVLAVREAEALGDATIGGRRPATAPSPAAAAEIPPWSPPPEPRMTESPLERRMPSSARDPTVPAASRVPAKAVPPPTPSADAAGALPLDPLQLGFGVAPAGGNPFADILGAGQAPAPSTTPRTPPPGPIAARGAPAPAVTPPIRVVPDAPPAQPTVPPESVWGELEALTRNAPSSTVPPARPVIPEDFDAFAGPSQAGRNAADPLAELADKAVSLEDLSADPKPVEDLFGGLKPLDTAVTPVLADPNASPLDPLAGASTVDPLALFGVDDPLLSPRPATPGRAPMADHVHEIDGYFRPPEVRPDPQLVPQPAPLPPGVPEEPSFPPHGPQLPDDLDLGLPEPYLGLPEPPEPPEPQLRLTPQPAARPRDGRGSHRAIGEAPAPLQLPPDLDLGLTPTPPVAHAPATAPGSPPERDLRLPTGGSPASAADAPAAGAAATRPARVVPPRFEASIPQAAEAARPAPADALLAAFLRGAGIPDANIAGGLTPALMETVGDLLATAIQGTLDLLTARGVVKREVKAEVTMIVARNNNPLKFLPDAQSALLQMFGQRIPGFMGPTEAMRDAYIDLRAHEVGMVAGMRAALAEVLERFAPGALEARITERGMLDPLFPSARRARLWERYVEMHEEISREAQDDFHALFGKAFVAAYEEEIERVRKGTGS